MGYIHTPTTSVARSELKVEPPLPEVSKVDEKEFQRRLDAKGLLTKEERKALASVDGTSGAVQIGKKAAKARLKKYCSDNLVEELIEKNRISRVEEHLQAVEMQMAEAYRQARRKLIKSDLKKPEKLETKPNPPPGHASYED